MSCMALLTALTPWSLVSVGVGAYLFGRVALLMLVPMAVCVAAGVVWGVSLWHRRRTGHREVPPAWPVVAVSVAPAAYFGWLVSTDINLMATTPATVSMFVVAPVVMMSAIMVLWCAQFTGRRHDPGQGGSHIPSGGNLPDVGPEGTHLGGLTSLPMVAVL